VSTAALGKVRLVETALGSEVAVRPAPLTNSYAIHIPLGGTMDVRRDGDSVSTGGVIAGSVMTPDATIDLPYSDDLRRLSVLVRRSDVDSAFHAMWGDQPRPGDFELDLDLRHSQVASWLQVVGWAAADLARSDIESRAAEPVTVAEVTPTAYLRELRLDRAHHELRSAEPHAGVTVTDTALRWGFGHLPRFAAVYQRKFGQLPSETLRHAVTRTQQARPAGEV
jgi:hypothetical protein